MKKIVIVFLVLVASATSIYSINSDKYEIFCKLNNQNTFNSLVSYLHTDYTQSEQLNLIFSMTEEKLNTALKMENNTAAEDALYFNLGNVKIVLSEEQYRKYLIIINLSVNNIANNLLL
ncbi:MAG: hypothetical protein ACOYMD_08380 [Paludibacter sp.]